MNIGDKVLVMYPFDPLWWKTEAVIIGKYEYGYRLEQANGQILVADEDFFKKLDERQEYIIRSKFGKSRIQTKDGVMCECGNMLKNFLEKCNCD